MVHWRHSSACDQVRPLLSSHIDGTLSSEQERAVSAHLGRCSACTEELRTLRLTVDLVRAIPQVPVPRSFLIAAPAVEPRLSYWYFLLRNASSTVAALLIAVLAFAYLAQNTARPFASVTAPPASVPQVQSVPDGSSARETEKESTIRGGAAATAAPAAGAQNLAAKAAPPVEGAGDRSAAPSGAAPAAAPRAPATAPAAEPAAAAAQADRQPMDSKADGGLPAPTFASPGADSLAAGSSVQDHGTRVPPFAVAPTPSSAATSMRSEDDGRAATARVAETASEENRRPLLWLASPAREVAAALAVLFVVFAVGAVYARTR